VDRLINILLTLTLVEMMIATGLGAALSEVLGVARDRALVVRAAVANYVCVPAVTVALLLLFRATPIVAAGFLVVAVCPGAPYGPPFTALAKGNVPVSVGLMVILAGSSAVVAPLLLLALLPWMAGDQPLGINAGKMVATLVLSQLLPLCLGLAVRRRWPHLAARLKKPADRAAAVLNVVLIGLILVVQFRLLAGIRANAFAGMLCLLAGSLLAGWALGGATSEGRKSMALTTGVRNIAVGLVIANSSFPGTAAVTAALAYALVQTVVVAVVALAWGRWSAGRYWRPSGVTTA
jgi:BASS family bile acid:Na+ symporter